LNHIQELAEVKGAGKTELFSAKLADCAVAQSETLADIIRRNGSCAFGKRLGFAEIADVDDFRNTVPISSWKDYEKLNERMLNGESDMLFSGRAVCFIETTGTTGREKLIPESAMGQLAKKVVGDLRNAFLLQKFPDLLKGKFLSLANSSTIGKTKGGIPYGMASGMTLDSTAAEILALSACPHVVKKIPDQKTADYAIMRFAVEQDVRVVTGNNPARLQALIELAEKRFDAILSDIANGTLDGIDDIPAELADELRRHLKPNPAKTEELENKLASGTPSLPSLYWPNLKVFRCWTSGSIGRYVKNLRPLLDKDILYVDGGYGASEGKFNIPLPNGKSSGPLANFAAFYEFVPASDGNDSAEPLLAHELEDGGEYRLMITTHSGLYRYDMRDIIRIDGFSGTTPNIEFISKTSDIGNICGEKMYPETIIQAFAETAETTGTRFAHYCAIPDAERQSYTLCVELETEPDEEELARLGASLDADLAKQTIGYEFLRGQGLLGPARCVAMTRGWKDALLRSKTKPGVSTSQIKLPVVCDAEKAKLSEFKMTK